MECYKDTGYCAIDDDTVLYRYIDYEHLKDLIITQELFMARADTFKSQNIDEKEFSLTDREKMNGTISMNPGLVEQQKIIQEYLRIVSCYKYASCWHIDSTNNSEMWKDVSKRKASPVAIKTTFGRIKKSLMDATRTYTCIKMKYIDYTSQSLEASLNLDDYIIHKHEPSFLFENEVRLITHKGIPSGLLEMELPDLVQCEVDTPHYIRTPVNIEVLIDSILVPKESSDEYLNEVSAFVRSYLDGVKVYRDTSD